MLIIPAPQPGASSIPHVAAQFLGVGEVARWQLAAAATCGMLLAPGWVAGMINTSWPWAAGA